MNESAFDLFLQNKNKVLGDYAKTIIQLLINEEKITREQKKYYLTTTKNIIEQYTKNLYFSSDSTFKIINTIINNDNDNSLRNAASIVHLTIEIDKILNPAKNTNVDLDTLKEQVAKILSLLNINSNSKKNKEKVDNLTRAIKHNYLKESRFINSLSNLENIKNMYIKTPYIKDTYLVKFEFDIKELDNFYPAQVQKAIQNEELQYRFLNLSNHILSNFLLKQLLLKHNTYKFIVPINQYLLKTSKRIKDLEKKFFNFKDSVIFMVDYTTYQKNFKKLELLKDQGFNYFLDLEKVSNKVEVNAEEMVLIDQNYLNLFPTMKEYFDNNQIIAITKCFDKTFTEQELLN